MKLEVQNEAFLASVKIPEAIAPVKATNELICFYSCAGTFASVGTAGTFGSATGCIGTFGTFGSLGTYASH